MCSEVKSQSRSVESLYTDVEWALSQGLPLRDIIPMLQRLERAAEPRSPYAVYAKRQLAELVVEKNPFRAARLASDVLAVQEDDRAYAALGLAHMLLGNFRLAEKAYRSALRMVPHCPWYAHNLGHLLDVGQNKPERALEPLRLAYRLLPDEPEIGASLAHALLRMGDRKGAVTVLGRAFARDESRGAELLERWENEL